MVSLFMAVSGGRDWSYMLEALEPLQGEYVITFLVFVTFVILALLNVITAAFVETAMQRSQSDRELMVQQEIENKSGFVAVMQQVFEELDANNSGALSLEEFERHIDDDKITAYLSTLGVDVQHVRTLFQLLDVDQTGEVDIDEFVSGCLRLKGGAKSLDLAILIYEMGWVRHNLQSLQKLVGDHFTLIE